MKIKILTKNIFASIFIAGLLVCSFLGLGGFLSKNDGSVSYAEDTSTYRTYVSDMTPIVQNIGYGSLRLNQNINGDLISFKVDGQRMYFYKGLIAHATSTLVYDIGEGHNFDYFSTYLGIDAVQSGKGNVKFSVYSSQDNTTWNTELEPTIKTSGDNAIFLKFSVKNVRYIKFYFDSNGSNGNDHSGLGDCQLYKTGYEYESDDIIKPVEYYNNLFFGKTTQEILESYTLEFMQRSFIDSIGYNNLKFGFLCGDDEQDYRDMLSWLYNDQTALKDFVTGGKPNGGNYIKALKVLSRLYKAHNDDLLDTTALYSPETGSTRVKGDVYRTMMISIALTNAKDVYGWVNSGDILDPLARYEALKYTYLASDYHLRYEIFENLCVEEMRYLMSSRINSEEIYWLNAYSTIKYLAKNSEIKYPQVYSPHSHIRYGRDWNYAAKGYYEEEHFEQYNQKYMLEQFGVTLTTTPRLWMAMDGSQICWGISYLGTNFASAFGVPSHYVRQPDHAAFFVYNKDTNDRTIWSIDNDIFGWTKTWLSEDTVGNGNNRMMCDWGTNGSEYVKNYNGSYILLSSTALDNQENYENAELVLSLKSMTNIDEQENLFRYALSFMPYHFDAWYELIKLYIKQNRADNELVSLAEEIAQNMYYFPLPMHELLGLIETELQSRNTENATIQLANVRNIDNIYLTKGTNAKNDENAKALISQPDVCAIMAKYLLGIVENEKLATFSFDGENQNKLVFNSMYTSVRYKYSIDGGTTWSDSLTDLCYKLSSDELDSITSDSDIYIWLEGWGTTIDLTKAFKIDIVDGTGVSNLEQNDNENKFLGTFTNLEYSLDNLTWQDLTEDSTFTGEKTVYVRVKRNGVSLAGEKSTYSFTDNTNTTREYISISHLEVVDYSSEETSRSKDNAVHIIDGKLSTRWHTTWSGGDNERYITVKLDKTRYISGIDYTPVVNGGNGTMLACSVYVSTDGETWTLAKTATGWGNNGTKKQMTFTPVLGQYIKVVGTNTVGGYCSARLFEFFEDTTLSGKQIASLSLSSVPKQDIYVIGQTISYSGLVAKVVFDDDTSAIIPNELLLLDDITFEEIGTKEITVEYGEFNTTFSVQVIDVSDSVARIGTTYYSSLDSAISRILDGDTTEYVIELMKDALIDKQYTITKNIEINGNNHTLTRQTDFLSSMFLVSGANCSLTLKDLTIDGGAVWTGDINETLNRGTTNSGIVATSPLIKMSASGSILSLENCTLQNNYNNYTTDAQNAGGAIFLGSSSSATLTNVNIKNCYSNTFGSAIYTRDTSKLVINSGKFTGNSGNLSKNTTAICVDNSSTCVVNGGEFTNNLAYSKGGVFWVSNGRLDINGGKFGNNIATNGAGIYLNGSAKVNIADFEEMQDIYLVSGKTINILGMFSGKTLNIKLASSTDGTTVAICDDREIIYKVLKALNVDDKLLYVDGTNIKLGDTSTSKASIQNGEKVTHFTSFGDALNASDSGDTITLLDNITIDDEIIINHQLTIDFSNYNLIGYDKIKTTSAYCVKYGDNILSVDEHTYNRNINYTWSDDNTTCTAKGYCECGEYYEETVTATEKVDTGVHTGDKTVTKIATFTYSEFEKQEKVILQVVNGHKYNQNITYTWGDDNTTCTAKGYCECGEYYEETVTATKTIIIDASYDSAEYSTFVAEFTYSEFIKQTKENVKTGEKLTKPNDDKNTDDDTKLNDDKDNVSDDKKADKTVLIASICGGAGVLLIVILIIALKRRNKNIYKRK